MRNLEMLLRRVREELRAEGPDEAGYSDFIVLNAINFAISDLSEVFPVQDTVELITEADTNKYELGFETVYDIVKVVYDGTILRGMQLPNYLNLTVKDVGPVNHWVLWGTAFILVGKVEADKPINLWVTRAPNKLEGKDDIPELPSYADEAIIAYALSVCYRESRNFDRADYYYRIYVIQKSNILRRGVPQRQKEFQPQMNDSYWKPVRHNRSTVRTDTNPGGTV